MSEEIITIRVYRYDPDVDVSPKIEEYAVEKYPGMRAVEALEKINQKYGANIAFSWSCKEWHCGSCGVLINGVPTLLCRQEIFDGDIIEPLPLPVVRDLVVDRSALAELSVEIYRKVDEFGASGLLKEEDTHNLKDLGTCMDCDVCYVSCPYFVPENKTFVGPEHMVDVSRFVFDPRINQNKALRVANELGVWDCITCKLCDVRCPKEINPMEWILSVRQRIIETPQLKLTPPKIRDLNESLLRNGNPYGLPRRVRGDWAKDLEIKDLSKDSGAEYLYFAGCAQCYDPRDQIVAKAIVGILKVANIDFGILGNEETCCGDAAKNTGEQGLYEELITRNTEMFRKSGVKRIVTTSPHCFNSFLNDYNLEIEVLHYTQLLAELIEKGNIQFSGNVDKKITYHDPCYLGRYNGVYDEPRIVLSSIPGVKLIEMDKNREMSFCCGGGGGGNWIETETRPRLSEIRAKQAEKTGAEILAVACPFCRAMLEDAIKSSGINMEVKHIAELVFEAMEVERCK